MKKIKLTIDIEVDFEKYPLFATPYRMKQIFEHIQDKYNSPQMEAVDFDWSEEEGD